MAFTLLTLLAATLAIAEPASQPAPATDTRISPTGIASSEADPFAPALLEFNRKRARYELDIRRIRTLHFLTRHTPTRQAGIAKLRAITAPEAFAPMLATLGGEDDDARLAALDHLADQPDPRADAVLAWHAVFDGRERLRAECRERLAARAASRNVPEETRSAVAEGLRSDHPPTAAQAAELAERLNLLDALPMVIRAQVNQQQAAAGGGASVGGGGGTSLGSDTALAYIIIGRQTTFVADLTPVVGQNAVAFDPTIGVITEGAVLRITDAVVRVYNVALHNTLTRWSSAAWGRSTEHLGWDVNAWLAWYADEFRPMRAPRQADEAEAAK